MVVTIEFRTFEIYVSAVSFPFRAHEVDMQNSDLDEPSDAIVVISEEDASTEFNLSEKIPALWVAHRESKVAAKRSRQDLAEVRRQLAEELYRMKSLLARTGRSGLWSSFLRRHKIPRTTADRLASSHEASLKSASGNCPSDAISEPMEVQVHRLIQRIYPQIAKVVTSKEAAFAFVCEILGKLPDADFYIGESYIELHRSAEQVVA